MGYTISTLDALVECGCEIHLVYWDTEIRSNYQMPFLKNIHKYPRSKQNLESIKQLIIQTTPDITVVSGWQDPLYVKVVKFLRTNKKLVVAGMDQQWHYTNKQMLAYILGKFGYFRRLFSHVWVSGVFQYEYARKLGYKKSEIIFDLYSADLRLFNEVYRKTYSISYFPKNRKRFLYVGRYEPIKGLDTLLDAWRLLGTERKNWELHLIGSGSLRNSLVLEPGIVVKDFMQPYELISEISNAGCFIMPSKGEPWGVVAQEMAAAGLPLIVSDIVGSSKYFVINGFNGYVFKNPDPIDLSNCMKRLINLSSLDLFEMGQASHELAQRITPMSSAKNLLSLIK